MKPQSTITFLLALLSVYGFIAYAVLDPNLTSPRSTAYILTNVRNNHPQEQLNYQESNFYKEPKSEQSYIKYALYQ